MDTIKFEKDKFLFSYKKSCESYSYENLIAIEYEKPYIVLRVDKSKLVFQMNLCEVLEKLPFHFQLVNRSTIINMERAIRVISQNKEYFIQMDNELVYKISCRKVAVVKENFMRKDKLKGNV